MLKGMNCKAGQVAYVARTPKRYEWMRNTFVKTVSFTVSEFIEEIGRPAWVLEKPLISPNKCPGCGEHHSYESLPDAWLRPIEDKPGEDEMLRITGLPEKLADPVAPKVPELVGGD